MDTQRNPVLLTFNEAPCYTIQNKNCKNIYRLEDKFEPTAF